MYVLKFTNKFGRPVELRNYESKAKANKHGDMLMQARETGSFQVISVDTSKGISDISKSDTSKEYKK